MSQPPGIPPAHPGHDPKGGSRIPALTKSVGEVYISKAGKEAAEKSTHDRSA